MTISEAIKMLDLLYVLDAPNMAQAINMAKDVLREADKLGGFDRLHELETADREGRCVVLPDGGYADKDGENALKSAMHTCFCYNNPVTRYIADAVVEKLTRESEEKER